MKVPKATLVLCIVTIGAYLLVSGGEPYIYPLETIQLFGVAQTNLLGAISYFFMHIGFKHLIGNIVSLLAMGAVLEAKIKPKHVAGLYIASGVGAGIGYAIISPQTWIVGASAAISGVILASYVADIKKAAVVMLAALLITHYAIFPATDNALDSVQDWMVKQGLEATQQVEALEKNIAVVEGQMKAEKDPVKIEQLVGQQAQYAQQMQVAQEKSRTIRFSEVSISQGRETEGAVPASLPIHIMGMLVSVLYLYSFDRKVFKNLRKDLNELIKH